MFNFITKIVGFLDLGRIWHLGGFGHMENMPKEGADDLLTILGIFKDDPKSRSVNNSLQRSNLSPNCILCMS